MSKFDLRCMQDEMGKTSVRVSHFEYLYVTYMESLYEDLENSFNPPQGKFFFEIYP